MKQTALILGALVAFSWLTIPLSADAPPLGPGGIHLRGAVNAYGQFQMDMQVNQGTPGPFTILAVKVYAEPSETFLCALVDNTAPDALLQSLIGEKPEALSTDNIGSSKPHFTLSPPPPGDTGIRLDYVIRQEQGMSTLTLSQGNFQSASAFEFSSEPDSGGGIKHCGYCGGAYCGCVTCMGPWTLCCPSCTLVCGAIICP